MIHHVAHGHTVQSQAKQTTTTVLNFSENNGSTQGQDVLLPSTVLPKFQQQLFEPTAVPETAQPEPAENQELKESSLQDIDMGPSKLKRKKKKVSLMIYYLEFWLIKNKDKHTMLSVHSSSLYHQRITFTAWRSRKED